KFLSLLTLDAAIAAECRRDATGTFTRKHMEALARAPKEEQATILTQVREQHLTATQTDALVRKTAHKQSGMEEHKPRRAGKHFRFATLKAVVSIQFRRSSATTEDVLEALDAARRMAAD